jgi:hypothetical protein
VAQEVYDNQMNLVHFFIGNVPHSEHVMSANTKARALINSHSKLQQTPGEIKFQYMKENPDADHDELKSSTDTFLSVQNTWMRERNSQEVYH